VHYFLQEINFGGDVPHYSQRRGESNTGLTLFRILKAAKIHPVLDEILLLSPLSLQKKQCSQNTLPIPLVS
jgi:hypothetical protein